MALQPLLAGLSSEAKQEETLDALASIFQQLAIGLAVSGPLTNAQLRAAAIAITAVTLPLPAGAATSAKQDALLAAEQSFQGAEAIVANGDLASAVNDRTPRRAIAIVATTSGNVVLKLSDGSSITVPVTVGLSVLPFAVKAVVNTGTTATATYFNLV